MYGGHQRKMEREGSKRTEGMEMEGNGDDKEEKNCRSEQNKQISCLVEICYPTLNSIRK